jgi:hypothetical protein
MKTQKGKQTMAAFVMFTLTAGLVLAASDLRIRTPTYDAYGRFWVYRNGPDHPHMPFLPYGWMSDATTTDLAQVIQVNLECQDRPNALLKNSTPAEKDYCIRAKISWGDATWASIAFISGPDKPAWWGETNTGSYFDLSSLPKKKLVFFARGERGGEIIQAQIGLLGGKPYGDSLAKPVVSEDLKLTQDWTRYEMDLSGVSSAELARICNGFGVIAQLAKQPGTPTETVFYIDDVFYE